MTRYLAAALALCLAGAAHAQARTLPADAKAGKLRHVQEMLVTLDGKPARLARGAQVRDAHNRILVPAAIPANSLVAYRLNAQGEIAAAWILAPLEAARFPAPAK